LARDSALADDLVQDTLERALRAASQFRMGTSLRAWLLRIMRNLFTDGCRKSAHLQRLGPEVADALPAEDARGATLLDYVTTAAVHAALATMTPFHREIFVMAYMERLPYHAIARRLRIPVSTVGTRLWRAKGRVRRILEQSAGSFCAVQLLGVGHVPSANDVVVEGSGAVDIGGGAGRASGVAISARRPIQPRGPAAVRCERG
jgi:RNA polymerase sigma-70 factor (ECF subfamily)